MLRQTKVVSISLPENIYIKLEKIRKKEDKSRSELIKQLIQNYEKEELWQQVYRRGAQTKKQFNITSEDDILKIIND
ncbi:ribbon-helix-helix protein, CopG family [Candidatus Roizmanbacteria bacterium]|nr:ribbon-helix-helix protein, CopG family [Candidatus Roizmanbacteria bacterium]